MARVSPFIATRYNPNAVADLAAVMAPPYDVISPEMQEALYRRAPENIVRLILGKQDPADDEYNNKYQRAASLLKQWRSAGVLIDDPEPCYYVYQQEFKTPDGRKNLRTGFFGSVGLEHPEKGCIHAHEHTFEGPKADRLKLLRTTRCNLSPIFLLYSDPQKQTDALLNNTIETQKKPRIEIVDEDKIVHRLWLMEDPADCQALTELLAERELFIADGHHRYETSVRYWEQSGKDGPKPEAAAATLGFLCNMDSEGLRVLPTHRVLSAELGEDVDPDEILQDLEEFFDTEALEVDLKKPASEASAICKRLEKASAQGPAFAMVLPDGRGCVIRLKPEADILPEMPEGIDPAIARLDVSVLHLYIIPRVWVGNPEIELDDQDVFYVKDAGDALRMLQGKPPASAVFLMAATRVDQVRDVASRKLRMPHKSTYFYPKLLTGMVLRDHAVCKH